MNAMRVALVIAAIAMAAQVAAGAEEPARPLSVSIVKTEGTVDVKAAEGVDWRTAEVGEVLAEGAELFTGSRSMVELAFEDSSVAVVRSLSHVRIDQALRSTAAAEVQLDINIGEVGVETKETDLKTDFKVRTPDFTVSIRGSKLDAVWAYEVGSAAAMRVHTADVLEHERLRRTAVLGPGEETDSDFTPPVVRALEGRRVILLPAGITGAERRFSRLMAFPTDTIPTDLIGGFGRPASRHPFKPVPPARGLPLSGALMPLLLLPDIQPTPPPPPR